MASVLVLDNYDSFTFNLVQLLGELGAVVAVERNDRITVGEVARRRPDAVVISPGPGGPSQAGVSAAVTSWCATTETPLLGVCLGLQVVAEVFGGRVVPAAAVMHGKTSLVRHDGAGIFAGLASPLEAMRYHSLVADRSALPAVLAVSAWTEDGTVMGLRHAELPIEAVQFHPESVLTPDGRQMLATFLDAAR